MFRICSSNSDPSRRVCLKRRSRSSSSVRLPAVKALLLPCYSYLAQPTLAFSSSSSSAAAAVPCCNRRRRPRDPRSFGDAATHASTALLVSPFGGGGGVPPPGNNAPYDNNFAPGDADQIPPAAAAQSPFGGGNGGSPFGQGGSQPPQQPLRPASPFGNAGAGAGAGPASGHTGGAMSSPNGANINVNANAGQPMSAQTTPPFGAGAGGSGGGQPEGWTEYNIAPGHFFDADYMAVVGSDYSDQYGRDVVVRTEKPGMRFGMTMVERAQVVLSKGAEPLMEGEEPPVAFDLGPGEYSVNRGTKIDRNKMYVMDFRPSKYREGGTVLRTVTPGLRDEYGSTVRLAEVVASSGTDGKWREPKATMSMGDNVNGSSVGGEESRSKGMVAFSSPSSFGSGRRGVGGGMEEPGYTFGPPAQPYVDNEFEGNYNY